jgi:hypothetical protein
MQLLLRAGNSPLDVSGTRLLSEWGDGNSGNVIFAHAVYKHLFKKENKIDVNGYNPDFANADEINERYDAFVLPLANAFRPAFIEKLEQYTNLILNLRIPCVVVGVGAQAGLDLAGLKGGAAIDLPVRKFVSAVLDRSATMGVRGIFTAEYLQRLGFRAVDVIGCPSMFYNGPGFRVEKPNGALDTLDSIALNHTPGVKGPVSEFVRGVLMTRLSSSIVTQDLVNARHWRTFLAANVPESANRDGYGNPADRVRFFTDIPPWLAFMRTCKFSIGTRIHGNVAALLAGVPAMVIAHDSRTLELSMHHRIPHVLANAVSESSSLAQLYEMADCGPANDASSDLFGCYKGFLERNGIDHALDDPGNADAFESITARIVHANPFGNLS